MTFEELGVIPEIQEALENRGYDSPTPIQEKAIPSILEGKDLQGSAQTGTGKTAAFCIPIIQLLKKNSNNGQKIRALILTPTRELALQVANNFSLYNQKTKLKQLVIFGGVPHDKQIKRLKQGVEVLIATPGRLMDLHQQGFVNLKHIEMFVLDEADKMLDMGFINDIKKIITLIPSERQTLLFSATMPATIQEISKSMLNNPLKIAVTPVSSTADTIDQYIYYVDKRNKKQLLFEILDDNKKESILIFMRTKRGANHLAKTLNENRVKAEAIHGNKSQTARQRALENFKKKKTRILVATDIAARGIDISQLKYVINFEIPEVAETYVHRIGRSGRAGEEGTAISLADGTELQDVKNIEKLIGHKIPEIKENPFPMLEKEKDIAQRDAKRKKQIKRSKQGNRRKQNTNKKS
ncbi:DEAD/DEAH box helicase [Flammeovirga sp. EKP202]|uniref:DEAD/DEAH box helicase n=1 Tax=Flammeovirga sp. EKP202 TaxID=2770592 RepID=UPI00165F9DE8|nr:DEAD/DEAH box helicase [Flammeovirga sp. EKP202]MBD0403548.1 DEAD/DEAH box helicase [Flammeovirga sp. EKP202]